MLINSIKNTKNFGANFSSEYENAIRKFFHYNSRDCDCDTFLESVKNVLPDAIIFHTSRRLGHDEKTRDWQNYEECIYLHQDGVDEDALLARRKSSVNNVMIDPYCFDNSVFLNTLLKVRDSLKELASGIVQR